MFGLFGAKGQGTQIHIWNLEEWGSECHLEWTKNDDDADSSEEGDILIRSRRARKRPGQFSKQVKSFPLAKSLNETKIIRGDIMGKPIQLILGRRQKERELMNGGMFLYWRGRLIEFIIFSISQISQRCCVFSQPKTDNFLALTHDNFFFFSAMGIMI